MRRNRFWEGIPGRIHQVLEPMLESLTRRIASHRFGDAQAQEGKCSGFATALFLSRLWQVEKPQKCKKRHIVYL